MSQEIAIRDLALIGNRRTAALLTCYGDILWYCPGRFDAPSLFAALLDAELGGAWKLGLKGTELATRRYLEDSGVLETRISISGGEWILTDFLPYGAGTPRGICRLFSAAPEDVSMVLQPAPNYARRPPKLELQGEGVAIDGSQTLYASHPLRVDGDTVRWTLTEGDTGWAVLLDEPLEHLSRKSIEGWLGQTLASWRRLASHATYEGPYEEHVADSLRALRLLTFEDSGGIIAAPTTSLPEVIGGRRNYDYRYVWLRDSGMIVSALTRAGSDGTEERRFLEFICGTNRNPDDLPLAPFATLDGRPVLDEETLGLAGYRGSQPVQIGNGAKAQLQLDAYGNVLLAAKLIYSHFGTREHWSIVERLADYLAEHWAEPDHGLWEEREKRQYTSSKVIVACGLDSVADFTESETQRRRWRAAVKDIRQFVTEACINSEGAYAAVAGGEAVDVSAALFPVWAYTAPDTPEMKATMKVLERDHGDRHLYRRHLEDTDSSKEGAFLAGTFWVAQYWVMLGDLERAVEILEAGLVYANDLGLFSEEADPNMGQMLGNFPQTFVHAAFIGAVIDLKAALTK